MTAFKAKVKADFPSAFCIHDGLQWSVWVHKAFFGSGKTAFAAWVDAWRNIGNAKERARK